MPLVRSDGLPTQHMRALAYWSAAPELDDVTSLQVCGTEWVSHVTCRRQLIDVLALASNGTRTRSNGNGRGGPPTHDVFHGMVARDSEAVSSSSKEGALLIDDLVEWVDEQLDGRPGAGGGARRATRSPERIAAADRRSATSCCSRPRSGSSSSRSCCFEPERSLGWDIVARPGARAAAEDGARRSGRPAPTTPTTASRSSSRSSTAATCAAPSADLDPVPLARYLSHFARWYAERERSPRVDGWSRRRCSTQGVRGLGLEAVVMRTLLVDNHDSYTYNVFHLLAAASGEEPIVVNNDAVCWRVLSRSNFDAIVLSPGPGTAGTLARLRRLPGHPPLQRDAGAGDLPRPPGDRQPARRRASAARRSRCTAGSATSATTAAGIFDGRPAGLLGRPLPLAGDHRPGRPEGHVVAWADDGVVMGVEHDARPMWGVQFHPESIATEHGDRHRRELLRARAERRRQDRARRSQGPRSTGRCRRPQRRLRPIDRAARGRPTRDARLRRLLARTLGGGGADRAPLRTALRRRRARLLARQRRRADRLAQCSYMGTSAGRASAACSTTTSTRAIDARSHRAGGERVRARARSSTCSSARSPAHAVEPPAGVAARLDRRLRRLPRLRAEGRLRRAPTCTAPTSPTRC